MNFETGAHVGAYQLEQHCGGGAYGEVFVARNVLTKERLALKVLHASSRMKKRELSGLVRYCGCRHPHLIRIFHVEEAGERFYYTMELADDLNEGRGEYVPATLAALLEKRKHLPADEVESLGNALCAALKTLHEKGLVHRDVKPANILFVRGEPVLGDPGLTADADGNSLVGTPEFMSPELLQKKRGSALPEDDFYALRRVLYCAFTGEGPAEFPHCPAGLLDERSSGLWRKILGSENFSAGPEDAPRPRSVYRRPPVWGSVAVLALAALTAALFLLRSSPPPRKAASPLDLAELLRRYRDDEAECEKFRLPAEKRFEEHFDSFRAAERSLVSGRESGRITPAEFAMKKGELGRLHVERKRRDPLLQLRDTQRDLQNELEWLAAAESVSGPVAAKKSLERVAELFRKRHALLAELRKKQSPSSLLSK